jgi:hypothetical protein
MAAFSHPEKQILLTTMWIGIIAAIVVAAVTAVGFGGYALGKDAGRAETLDARVHSFQEHEGSESMMSGGSGDGGAGQAEAAGSGGRGMMAGNFAGGQVKSVNGDTIELSTSTEVLKVKVNSQTQYQKTVNCSLADLQPGERIVVQGERSSDGALLARSIQIGGGGSSGGRGAGNGQ